MFGHWAVSQQSSSEDWAVRVIQKSTEPLFLGMHGSAPSIQISKRDQSFRRICETFRPQKPQSHRLWKKELHSLKWVWLLFYGEHRPIHYIYFRSEWLVQPSSQSTEKHHSHDFMLQRCRRLSLSVSLLYFCFINLIIFFCLLKEVR